MHAELHASTRALRVGVRLAEHLRWRAMRVMADGLEHWYDFINQVREASMRMRVRTCICTRCERLRP